MARKEILKKIPVYIPQKAQEERLTERLMKLGEKRDRLVNYLVVETIRQFLKSEEMK